MRLLSVSTGLFKTLPPYTQQDPRVTYKNWVHIPKINYKRRKLVEFKSKGRTRTISMYCYIKHLTLRKHQSIVASSCRCATVISGSKLPEPWFIPVFGGFHYHQGNFQMSLFLLGPKYPKNARKSPKIPKIELFFWNMAMSYIVGKYFLR